MANLAEEEARCTVHFSFKKALGPYNGAVQQCLLMPVIIVSAHIWGVATVLHMTNSIPGGLPFTELVALLDAYPIVVAALNPVIMHVATSKQEHNNENLEHAGRMIASMVAL